MAASKNGRGSGSSDRRVIRTMVDPFDISMHYSRSGLADLQNRFANWLRQVDSPTRFVAFQVEADLDARVTYLRQLIKRESDDRMRRELTERRRFYEELDSKQHYQQLYCGLMQWVNNDRTHETLAASIRNAFQVGVYPDQWLNLFQGRYVLRPPEDRRFPYYYMMPVGRPGGRMLFHFMISYEFLPVDWSFAKPFGNLLSRTNFNLAIAIDMVNTYDRRAGITKVERFQTATRAHLRTSKEIDSSSNAKFRDSQMTLQQLQGGDLLHEVQVIIAVAAPNLDDLHTAVEAVRDNTNGHVRLRSEPAPGQSQLANFFGAKPSKHIVANPSTWHVVSNELAVMFSPLGFRKLSQQAGTLRGQSRTGKYPYFFNSWKAKKEATHEIWVGSSGYGKTFALNLYLRRQWVEERVPYDLLEPMGHGNVLSKATVGAQLVIPDPSDMYLNPLDIMFSTPTAQSAHVTRIVETLIGRTFAGGQQGNFEKGLVALALERVYAYSRHANILDIGPRDTPIFEDFCQALREVDGHVGPQGLGKALADELGGLVTGYGTYAEMFNGQTNVDLSVRANAYPRCFSFHKLPDDPIMYAVAYTQILSAIRRDSLIDERPRTIAIDEVYRMMSHPSLLDFMVEAVKTFRTRRKKLILIDQNMRLFIPGPGEPNAQQLRLVFENVRIRMIFNQGQGLEVFTNSKAFDHFTQHHLQAIKDLQRGECILDISDVGVQQLYQISSAAERQIFGAT